MELIPAIDLRGGCCVRLLKGEFARETVYSRQPAEVLERYAALGARRVHVVDLDGARSGTQHHLPIIRELTARSCAAVQVGGGLRDRERVGAMLDAGVERVVIGSRAVTDPAEVIEWLGTWGPSRLVLAFDVRLDAGGVPRLTTHGWQRRSEASLWDLLPPYVDAGLLHVLCTDVDRDGTLGGPNGELYGEAVRRFPGIAWQASGGVATGRDLAALATCGVAAAISGRALLEDRIPAEELQPYLPNASSPA
jgi:phosphoribosylformimino-5-aminoimidazole carboxamide ribotide isomerase